MQIRTDGKTTITTYTYTHAVISQAACLLRNYDNGLAKCPNIRASFV